mgnify:CR=1 FL=1
MKKIRGEKTIIEEIFEGESMHEYAVDANSDLTLLFIAASRKSSIIHVRVRLEKPGARAAIIGMIIGKGESRFAIHTLQEHTALNTTSDLLIKTVLSDSAACMYDGGIRVEKYAQKTDAYQRNENLLLSGRAHAESKPTLEILANDVRCTHGATIGPISEEQLWYLATRGVAKKNAERLIVSGFLAAALEKVSDLSVRTSAADRIATLVAQS